MWKWGTGASIDSESGLRWRVVMPRTSRVAPGGMVFHVLNRGVGRMRLFDVDDDYPARWSSGLMNVD